MTWVAAAGVRERLGVEKAGRFLLVLREHMRPASLCDQLRRACNGCADSGLASTVRCQVVRVVLRDAS